MFRIFFLDVPCPREIREFENGGGKSKLVTTGGSSERGEKREKRLEKAG